MTGYITLDDLFQIHENLGSIFTVVTEVVTEEVVYAALGIVEFFISGVSIDYFHAKFISADYCPWITFWFCGSDILLKTSIVNEWLIPPDDGVFIEDSLLSVLS